MTPHKEGVFLVSNPAYQVSKMLVLDGNCLVDLVRAVIGAGNTSSVGGVVGNDGWVF